VHGLEKTRLPGASFEYTPCMYMYIYIYICIYIYVRIIFREKLS